MVAKENECGVFFDAVFVPNKLLSFCLADGEAAFNRQATSGVRIIDFFSRYAVRITWFGDCFSSLRSADCNICHLVYSRFSIAFLQHQDGGIAQASLYFMRHAFWCARTQHWFDKPPRSQHPHWVAARISLTGVASVLGAVSLLVLTSVAPFFPDFFFSWKKVH